MKNILMAAALTLAMTAGAAMAQMTTSSTTTTQSTGIAPVPPATANNVDTMTQHSVNAQGVVTDKAKTTSSGVTVSPEGDTTATKKSTETTTVR